MLKPFPLTRPWWDRLPALAVTAVLALLVVTLAAVGIAQERQRQREQALNATQNIALALEGRVGDLIDQVDMVLRLGAINVQALMPSGENGLAALDRRLKSTVHAMPVVRTLYVFDADGRLVINTRPEDALPKFPSRVAMRQASIDHLVQSGPIFSDAAQGGVLLYSLPVRDDADHYLGSITAVFEIDHLLSVFRGIDLGVTGAVSLRTASLELVYRQPWPSTESQDLGSQTISSQLRHMLNVSPGHGEYMAVTPLDGIRRINAYRQVRGHDLILFVGVPETDFPQSFNKVDLAIVSLALLTIGLAGYGAMQLSHGSRRAIHAAQRQYESIVASTRDAIIVVEPDGLVRSWNDGAQGMFGFNAGEMIGQPLSKLFPAERREEEESMLERLRHGEALEHFETERVRKDGLRVPVSVTLSPMCDSDGRLTAISCIARDITRQKAMEDEVRSMAFMDPLTRLPNRRLLMERLQQAQVACRRYHSHAALLFVDLDHFKVLNDRYGHAVGDRVLQELATRLRRIVRESDTVGRLGGDEFVMICGGLGLELESAIRSAAAVRSKVQGALDIPYEVDGVLHAHGASVGVRVFGAGTEDLDTLIRDADKDMYENKAFRREAESR